MVVNQLYFCFSPWISRSEFQREKKLQEMQKTFPVKVFSTSYRLPPTADKKRRKEREGRINRIRMKKSDLTRN